MYNVKLDGRDCGNCTMAIIMPPELFKEWEAGNVLTELNIGNFAEMLSYYREENPIEKPESWMIDNLGMFVRNDDDDMEAFEDYYNDLIDSDELELDNGLVELVTMEEMSLYDGDEEYDDMPEDEGVYHPLMQFSLTNGWGVIMSAHYEPGVIDYGDGEYERWAKQIEDAINNHPNEIANTTFIQEFVEN